MSLVVGECFEDIYCENFRDPETGRIRVRPLLGHGLPESIVIECSKKEREQYQPGTHFVTESVKVCKKPDGRIYLRAKDQKITKVDKRNT